MSPTSVETTGQAIAIASQSDIPQPSARDEQTYTSRRLKIDRTSLTPPVKKMSLSDRPTSFARDFRLEKYDSWLENTDPIILPHRYKPANTFEILTETEINQLTNEEYKNYKVELDEHFLLNPINSQVYHETTTYDKKVKEMEDEFNDSSSDNEIMDDY